jgi:hypothetical protein
MKTVPSLYQLISYGELEFTLSYKGQTEDTFPWLYLDYNTLQNVANDNGLTCELIKKENIMIT